MEFPTGTFDLGEIAQAVAFQTNGVGGALMLKVSGDGFDQLGQAAKTPRRRRLVVRSRKNRSTMLSHEALVGVKCR